MPVIRTPSPPSPRFGPRVEPTSHSEDRRTAQVIPNDGDASVSNQPLATGGTRRASSASLARWLTFSAGGASGIQDDPIQPRPWPTTGFGLLSRGTPPKDDESSVGMSEEGGASQQTGAVQRDLFLAENRLKELAGRRQEIRGARSIAVGRREVALERIGAAEVQLAEWRPRADQFKGDTASRERKGSESSLQADMTREQAATAWREAVDARQRADSASKQADGEAAAHRADERRETADVSNSREAATAAGQEAGIARTSAGSAREEAGAAQGKAVGLRREAETERHRATEARKRAEGAKADAETAAASRCASDDASTADVEAFRSTAGANVAALERAAGEAEQNATTSERKASDAERIAQDFERTADKAERKTRETEQTADEAERAAGSARTRLDDGNARRREAKTTREAAISDTQRVAGVAEAHSAEAAANHVGEIENGLEGLTREVRDLTGEIADHNSELRSLQVDINELASSYKELSTQSLVEGEALLQRVQKESELISKETQGEGTTAGGAGEATSPAASTAAPAVSPRLSHELSLIHRPDEPIPGLAQAMKHGAINTGIVFARHYSIIATSIFMAHMLSKLTTDHMDDLSVRRQEDIATALTSIYGAANLLSLLNPRLNPFTAERPTVMSDLGKLGMAVALAGSYAGNRAAGTVAQTAAPLARLGMFTAIRDSLLSTFSLESQRHPANPVHLGEMITGAATYIVTQALAGLSPGTPRVFSGFSPSGQRLPWSEAWKGFAGSAAVNAAPEFLDVLIRTHDAHRNDTIPPLRRRSDPDAPMGRLSEAEQTILDAAIAERLRTAPPRGLVRSLAESRMSVGVNKPSWNRFTSQLFGPAASNTSFFASGINVSGPLSLILPTSSDTVGANAARDSILAIWYGLVGYVPFSSAVSVNPTSNLRYDKGKAIQGLLGATVPKTTEKLEGIENDPAAQRR